ncbi:MAG: glycosyltransferase [Gemmatimonadetes bacterium]|jgi:hypothetical protein|nr:glycosyltransferase [Gemmatimonadota bacterium]MBT5143571.1 glycosyltransferase [Gemmatimonadota bacterium]MBT5873649.1 glycosyltransferase [Candidatus Latescibacterota bacterium]
MNVDSKTPVVTIAVPSLNQGRYLTDALESIFSQEVPVEVFVADGGSTDTSVDVIRQWEPRLSGWRSHPDSGQAAAINESIEKGTAPYVGWLNSDDCYLPGGLRVLVDALEAHHEWPAAYALAEDADSSLTNRSNVWVEPFNERRLAVRCFISQPATLIRRSAWEAVGGLNEDFELAMDYDLWWRLYRRFGPLGFEEELVALNRSHDSSKTRTQRKRHYQEAIQVVRSHYGRVPWKWWLYWVFAVWFRSFFAAQKR